MGESFKVPSLRTGGVVAAIVPQSMEETYRLADAVVRANMAPTGLETTEKVMIAMMYGMEIGLTPMAAIQRIAVVNNRPTIWGDAAIALVRASGQLERFTETIDGTGDDRIAICTVKRKGVEDGVIKRFSVQDAITAGLWSPEARVTRFKKDGGSYQRDNDSPWHRYPERMLAMRARGFALRDLFADVLGGLYLREEIEEDHPRAVSTYEPPAPPPEIEHTPAIPMEILKSEAAITVEALPQDRGTAVPLTGELLRDLHGVAIPDDDPPPPPKPAKNFDAVIEAYRDAVQAAKDSDALDTAWAEHITPVQESLSKDLWEQCAKIDDMRRAEIE